MSEDKLSVAAGAFFQSLIAENRAMKFQLQELEQRLNEIEADVNQSTLLVEMLSATLLRTIQFAKSGSKDDFEQIAWELKTVIPPPEIRAGSYYIEGMDFLIDLSEAAASIFPDDPYFKTVK